MTAVCRRSLDTWAAVARDRRQSPGLPASLSRGPKSPLQRSARTGEPSSQASRISVRASQTTWTVQWSARRAARSSSRASTATRPAAASAAPRPASPAPGPCICNSHTAKAAARPRTTLASQSTSWRSGKARIVCTTACTRPGTSWALAPSLWPKEAAARQRIAATTAPGVLKAPARSGCTRARAPFSTCTAQRPQCCTSPSSPWRQSAASRAAAQRAACASCQAPPRPRAERSRRPETCTRAQPAWASRPPRSHSQPPAAAKAPRAAGSATARSLASRRPHARSQPSSPWPPTARSSTRKTSAGGSSCASCHLACTDFWKAQSAALTPGPLVRRCSRACSSEGRPWISSMASRTPASSCSSVGCCRRPCTSASAPPQRSTICFAVALPRATARRMWTPSVCTWGSDGWRPISCSTQPTAQVTSSAMGPRSFSTARSATAPPALLQHCRCSAAMALKRSCTSSWAMAAPRQLPRELQEDGHGRAPRAGALAAQA
mmetsp:Transcript_103312/g.333239  ORF Transcript_103312/g.333239 Transcript_103312/m.333239 type:complete len:494 (+) Transcript_103312:962-2443(+)